MDRIALSSSTRREPQRAGLTHLVSLESRGMRGLAEFLLSGERKVSGSVGERTELDERLIRRGLRLHRGHAPSAVPHGATRLVYPPGATLVHPERLTALKRGVEQIPLATAVEEALGNSTTIAVVGRRVARVASAMIGRVLTFAGLDPTLLLDSELPDDGGFGRCGEGPYAVVDVPEPLLDAGALPQGGDFAMILDVGDLDAVAADALCEMSASMPGGRLFGVAGGRAFEAAAQRSKARVARLSLGEPTGSDWWGADLKINRGRYRFRIFKDGEFELELGLSCPGRRYVAAALAAVAACRSLELDAALIREALEEYLGASRAFSHRGTYRGVTLIDDDAVEPSDVAETLELARMVYGRRRLWAVYAETRSSEIPISCLAPADRVLMLGGRGGISGSDLQGRGGLSDDWLRHAADHEEALWNLDRHLEPGDVLVTLGSGETGTIADAFIRRLPRDRQGR